MTSPFQRVEADLAISITDLKKNPNEVMKAAQKEAVAILNHNKVVGYVVSAAVWEYVQDLYETPSWPRWPRVATMSQP